LGISDSWGVCVMLFAKNFCSLSHLSYQTRHQTTHIEKYHVHTNLHKSNMAAKIP